MIYLRKCSLTTILYKKRYNISDDFHLIKEKIMHWEGTIKDSEGEREVSEESDSWHDIKEKLVSLRFVLDDGKELRLPDNAKKYLQAKTASANLDGSGVQIESRYIGADLGSNIVRIRVSEKTGNVTIETELSRQMT
jgi:hypothetical protein